MGNPQAAFGVQVGDRIRLVSMGPDEPYPMPSGVEGEVIMLCDTSGLEQVCVKWDNGGGLNLVPGSDRWERL